MMRAGWLALALACAHGAPDAADAAAKNPPREARGSGGGDGGASDDDAVGCSADQDCSLTRIAKGACCASLCVPRPVTRKAAEALEAQSERCNQAKCVHPLCRPEMQTLTPACVDNRCIARPGPMN
jgi:hypothetical protein